MKLTTLRCELFQVIDQIIKTGQSVEIERGGHRLKITLDEKKDKFKNLIKRENVIACSEEELLASPVQSKYSSDLQKIHWLKGKKIIN